MEVYFHSVTLDESKCKGCTNCIKKCPTEAIRVREGKARIIEQRCIDCGECIRTCPNHAKVAVTDSLEGLNRFRYRVALPAPSFYGQFKPEVSLGRILGALLELGFDTVYEVAWGAEAVSVAVQEFLARESGKRPLISSACPAVIRLMQVRFPTLLDHVIPVDSPMEAAAKMAKRAKVQELGLAEEEIGAFFITPCPAKVTAVKQPFGDNRTYVDGAISMSTVYGEVLKALPEAQDRYDLVQSTGLGIGWGYSGGENRAIYQGQKSRFSFLAVDGIHSVISLLEQMERGDDLKGIDYVEAQACIGGCIGGPLVPQNRFVSRVQLARIADTIGRPEEGIKREEFLGLWKEGLLDLKGEIRPRPVMSLDPDIRKAIAKLEQLEKTVEDLPGLDCGSCGSPNCRALAEDIVRGNALETDCVFKLRERVKELAEEMVELAQKLPPAMGK
ncbi:MAG: 4Fe-4S binding protein [Clostridia bacterium]|nr:4Fe-4S binding protein [Clostridia bacterium]